MKIVISTGWSLSGPAVLEKRNAAAEQLDEALKLYADELFAAHPTAKMAHILTDGDEIDPEGGHWYKSRHDLGKTFERNGKTFSAGWTFNTND